MLELCAFDLLQIGEVPKLTSGFTEFIDSAENLEKRKMNQALLANHNTLLDLLEISQLMATCLRNEKFDEALDLGAFACKARVVEFLQQNGWSFVSCTGCSRKIDKSGTSLRFNRCVNHNVTGVI
ncbi:hypothetical protein HID58_065516 [Brassica napus]|uniref:Conserved oligomeric Golgi complex subunit 8 n=1 Tax=Brassica napus TaxID=3708 RepID=A0ABQ7ZDI3_BRANA|nr:hypothetical protein HID58_065516 [Brassica napus]